MLFSLRSTSVSLFQSPPSSSDKESPIASTTAHGGRGVAVAASKADGNIGPTQSAASSSLQSSSSGSTGLSPGIERVLAVKGAVKGGLKISPDQIKNAARAAGQGGQSSLLFLRTPVVCDSIIVGVICLVPNYNKNSAMNKQHWGFKPGLIKQILLLLSSINADFKVVEPLFSTMEPAHILAHQYSLNQEDLLARKLNSGEVSYPYECLTFSIDSSGKVVSANDLFKMMTSKLKSGFMHQEFRTLYQQICDSGDLQGFGNVIRKKDAFWNTFRRVTIVDEPNYLNKILPDEEIIKLVSSAIGMDNPNEWPADVVSACWKDGMPSEYH